jgi:hypothetical protein
LASELFLQHVLKHDLVQAQIGHQLLELAVLLFEPPRVRIVVASIDSENRGR